MDSLTPAAKIRSSGKPYTPCQGLKKRYTHPTWTTMTQDANGLAKRLEGVEAEYLYTYTLSPSVLRDKSCECVLRHALGVFTFETCSELQVIPQNGSTDCEIVIQFSLPTDRKTPMRKIRTSTAQRWPISSTPSISPAHLRSSNSSSSQQAQSNTVSLPAAPNSPRQNRTAGSKAMGDRPNVHDRQQHVPGDKAKESNRD